MKRITDHLEEYILIGSLFVSVTLVFVQIVMRYAFKNSIFWSEELVRYIFLWQIWLGASYATKENKHLRIEIIKDRLSGKNALRFEMLASTIWFAFCLFLAWKSFELTGMLFKMGQLSPAMRIPMWYAYASVPIGVMMMALRLLQRMQGLLQSHSKEGAAV